MSDSKYEIDGVSVEKLFGTTSIKYEIPRFQRPFSWTNLQVTNFISDVVKDENWLEFTKDGTAPKPYFFGAIVLSKSDEHGLMQILDGQQRLTTISLLLLALRIRLKKYDVEQQISTLRNCLSSARMREERSTPKLILQERDRIIYDSLIDEKRKYFGPDEVKSRLVRAFDHIDLQLNEFLTDCQAKRIDEKDALLSLADKILTGITFVQIVAPTEGDAFTLFETLNDRGLPLSGADLIKNKMLARSASTKQKKAVEEIADLWDEMISTVGDAEGVNYLRYFWLAFYAKGEITKAGLYNDYNKYIGILDITELKKFAKELRDIAVVYAALANPEAQEEKFISEDVSRTLIRLNSYRARTCRPLLLLCAVRFLDDFPRLVQFIESATVRTVVIGDKNPNVLDKTYTDLCTADRAPNAKPLSERLHDRLVGYVPSDDEFERQFISSDAEAGLSTVWRSVLLKLNEALPGGEAKLYGSKLVHVEHVLPQTLEAPNLTEGNFEDKDEATKYVRKIGNLTLLNAKRNVSLSNKPYSEKKQTYKDSDVALTREIAEGFKKWTAGAITERTEMLGKRAVKSWPW
jgi:uncharacterized protein with ParB-like and HNH nuclease domain